MPTLPNSQVVSDWLGGISGLTSTEQITLANTTGANFTLLTGTILGRLTDTGRFVPFDPGASDGSQFAVGILYDNATIAAATEANVTAITRDATVKDLGPIFPAGITGTQVAIAIGQLEGAGIEIISRATA